MVIIEEVVKIRYKIGLLHIVPIHRTRTPQLATTGKKNIKTRPQLTNSNITKILTLSKMLEIETKPKYIEHNTQ